MSDVPASSASPAPADLHKPRRRKAAVVDPLRVDRLPPHSIEAEQGVLGCVLLAPKEGMGLCVQKLSPGAECFYDLRHQTLFATLVDMYDTPHPIDVVTLGQRLKDQNQLEAVGGYAYLSSLLDAVPSAANLEYYADIVREKHLLRRMIQSCTSFITRAYEQQNDVPSLLDEVEREVLRISEEGQDGEQREMRVLVREAITTIQQYHENQGRVTGISTGYPDFDRMTSGMHGGEMVVIAARPSMGKTSLAMNIAEFVAVDQGLPVGVFSLEMTAASLVMRLLCSRATVNLRSVREGFLAERDFHKLTHAAGKFSTAPLLIDDTPGLSILQLRARARRLVQQHDIKLFVVDYLQLLHSTARRAEQNRQQEIADISSGVKALAKELNVPVIVLSQLNREVERDKARKPRLSDLRESGAIEQDADLVGLLYKADPRDAGKPASSDEDDETSDAEKVPVNLLIAKQRNGPTGDVHLTFFRPFTRFVSAAKVPDGAAEASHLS